MEQNQQKWNKELMHLKIVQMPLSISNGSIKVSGFEILNETPQVDIKIVMK